MNSPIHRREMLACGVAAASGVLAARNAIAETPAALADPAKGDRPSLRFCLNTSTVRGQQLTVVRQVELAAKAGYDGIEPWMGDLHKYREEGGSLGDLRKRIADAGLKVESAIGFARWIVDDEQERANGLEEAKRDMDVVAQIGGSRIAAPPTGATRDAGLNLADAAARYRKLLELGESMGVVPQLELWGFSKNLSRLGELLYVAIESGHSQACLLPDVYHIYKGGSDFAGLQLVSGRQIHVFHMNDYPADPPRESIGDANRVYPGLGVAPLSQILRTLSGNGFSGALSLELFNRDYWQQDALQVAETGLRAMREAVAKAFA
ncbi:MAG: sugar phosphate isomerase/epimerase [Planctomycetales bacterium]|nr:sugar phosphate isomerase/epimerase [Planctomycetales bacterium]